MALDLFTKLEADAVSKGWIRPKINQLLSDNGKETASYFRKFGMPSILDAHFRAKIEELGHKSPEDLMSSTICLHIQRIKEYINDFLDSADIKDGDFSIENDEHGYLNAAQVADGGNITITKEDVRRAIWGWLREEDVRETRIKVTIKVARTVRGERVSKNFFLYCPFERFSNLTERQWADFHAAFWQFQPLVFQLILAEHGFTVDQWPFIQYLVNQDEHKRITQSPTKYTARVSTCYEGMDYLDRK